MDFRSENEIKILNGHIGSQRVADSLVDVSNNKKTVFAKNRNFRRPSQSEIPHQPGSRRQTGALLPRGPAGLRRHQSSARRPFGAQHRPRGRRRPRRSLPVVEFSHAGDWRSLDVDLEVKSAFFKKGPVSLKIDKPKSIAVKKGVVKKWDVDINGNGFGLKTRARGDFKGKFKSDSRFEFDANLFELLTERIKISRGTVKGRALWRKDGGFLDLDAENLAFYLRNSPSLFQNTEFRVALDKKRLLLENFETQFGGGFVKGGGRLDFPNYLLNAKFNIDQVHIPYMEKSGFTVNGDMAFENSRLPYLLKGKIDIVQSEFKDEFKQMAAGSLRNANYQRFLPTTPLKKKPEFFKMRHSLQHASPRRREKRPFQHVFKRRGPHFRLRHRSRIPGSF